MWVHGQPRLALLMLAGAIGLAGSPPREGRVSLTPVQTTRSTPAASLAVVVLDSKGLPITGLRGGDFAVTVDGRPRTVVAVSYVFRGPGAGVAAARAGTDAKGESGRRLLFVIDAGSLLAGDERAVRGLLSRVIDGLGPADEIAVVSLPSPETRIELASDREAAFDSLGRVVGRAVHAPTGAAPAPLPATPGSGAAAVTEQSADPDARQGRQTLEQRALSDAAFAELGGAYDGAGSSPLPLLEPVLERLREPAGPKHIVLITAGLPDPPRSRAVERVASIAAAGETSIHVLYRRVGGWVRTAASSAPQADAPGTLGQGVPAGTGRGVAEQASGLIALAGLTGGSFVEVGRNIDQAVDRLVAGLGGDYTVTIETTTDDWDGKAHDVRVAVPAPKGTIVRCRERWMPVSAPKQEAENNAPRAAPETAARVPVTLGPAPVGPPAPYQPVDTVDPAFAVLLASVDEYLSAYERQLSGIVAEERYQQVARYRASGGSSERRSTVDLRSDFLLVQPPGGGMWIPFRDVFEVDGLPVRDRDERLKNLFLEKKPGALSEAQRITDEGARYNVGSVVRNVNVPTFALAFLTAANRGRFALTRHGEESIEGRRAWRIDYTERASPTFIQTAIGGEDLPVKGSIWIDPESGRVLRTLLRSAKGDVDMEVTVTYRPSETLGLWMPGEMKERYVAGEVTIDALATYSNFRRFRVLTEEQIKIPK